ncbi:uncharacterized protein LOC117169019 [Belonocnema kinseyi]|uniref:uncharacterized protein LOC117169019 n=1 Tax=Belonocnema kinseyi TaxID=2817044 RepID=UPI00143D51F2|nr:uncharacterized protein LOC117169019 [Belonocnema kinseyi]
MDPIKLRFFMEICEKENKYIRIQEKFIPSLSSKPITGKFYAKHDAVSFDEIPEDYLKLIERKENSVPRDRYSFPPPTANMDYGWFTEPLIPRSKDPRLHFATKGSDFLKTELKLRHLNRGLPVTKFVGVPFRS